MQSARVMQVSIHARHYWRARRPDASVIGWSNGKFQSTPAITGGRDNSCAPPLHTHTKFQSTPAITGGRDGRRTARRPAAHVSIHARHYWRARRVVVCLHHLFESFNPRPPLLAGETISAISAMRVRIVSIHARHYWRARR